MNQNVPPTYPGNAAGTIMNDQMQPGAVDTTSVLKQLTKTVTIGSTVDPTNGDQDPYGLAYVNQSPYGKSKYNKGDLLACNYSNKSGALGKGTTIEVLAPKPGSKPATLIADDRIQGCSAVQIGQYAATFTADYTAKNDAMVQPNGKFGRTFTNKGMPKPWSIGYVNSGLDYPPGDAIFTGDESNGKIVRVNLGAGSGPTYAAVISGFAVGKSSSGAPLGPTGIQYQSKGDTLYIFDGVTNTLVSISKAYNTLIEPNSIIVSANGKSFSGPLAKNAHLIYAGSSLKKPVASALLPNGNLVVANSGSTKGNYLVEIATNGKILANKNVDKGKPNAVHGLVAVGSKDSNTVIYFNDSNTNDVRLLTR